MKLEYKIVIWGHLTPQWSGIFNGLEVVCRADGNTLITGDLPNRAALYGLLQQMRDLKLMPVSINSFFAKDEE